MQSLFCRDAFADLGSEFSLLSDNRSAAACYRAERLGDFRIEALTTATFSGPVAVRGRPGDVCFNAEPVCLKV